MLRKVASDSLSKPFRSMRKDRMAILPQAWYNSKKRGRLSFGKSGVQRAVSSVTGRPHKRIFRLQCPKMNNELREAYNMKTVPLRELSNELSKEEGILIGKEKASLMSRALCSQTASLPKLSGNTQVWMEVYKKS
jgi:hypothetical protein